MSDEMPSDLRALLDEEKDRPGPSTSDSEALRAGLGSLLEGGGGGDGGGGPSGGGSPPGGGAGAGAAGGTALGKLAAVFVAGALAGGAVIYAVAPRTVVERVTVAAVPSASPVVASATPSSTVIEVQDPPPAAPSGSAAKAIAPAKSASAGTAASTDKRDDDLASERAILERARVALGRGDATGALEAIDRHATRHPSGRLAEEREVLAVQALVSAGRSDEARTRAARFHRDHPTSAFGSAVDALVR